MKKLYSYFLAGVLAIGTFVACQNEDEFPVPNLDTIEVGVIPRASINEGNLGLINPLDFDNTDVELTVDAFSDGAVDVENVEIYLTYNYRYTVQDSEGNDSTVTGSETRLYQTISGVPANVTFGTEELESLFNVDRDTFDVGESFDINYTFVTSTGRRINQWSADICNEPAYNGTCSISVSVSCPTSIPSGSYEVTAYANQNPLAGTTYTVNIQQGAGTQFSIANFNLDYQTPFYDTFNNLPIGGGFVDVCNEVTLNTVGAFGVFWSGTGTFDPSTNTITFPQIRDVGYGQGPWNNAGNGYVLTYTGN
jgi:hypothetical protein